MKVCVSVSLLVGYFVAMDAMKLPSYIKPCSRTDPKLSECALKHAKESLPQFINGDPKYKIPKLDPLVIERLAVDDNTNAAVGLSFVCEPCQIVGFKNAIVNGIRIDLDKKHFEIDMTFPKIDVGGKYNISGKILILPIKGNGDVKLSMTNEKALLKADFDLYKKKNKEYMKITKFNIDTTTSERFHVELTNLFNGDKNLGDNMNKFLNENWQDVVKVFAPMIENALSQVFMNIFNSIAELVPYDEFFTA